MIKQCLNCKFFVEHLSFIPLGKCVAFPKGIPKDIMFKDFDHTKKHPDQKNDIIFKPIKKNG